MCYVFLSICLIKDSVKQFTSGKKIFKKHCYLSILCILKYVFNVPPPRYSTPGKFVSCRPCQPFETLPVDKT